MCPQASPCTTTPVRLPLLARNEHGLALAAYDLDTTLPSTACERGSWFTFVFLLHWQLNGPGSAPIEIDAGAGIDREQNEP